MSIDPPSWHTLDEDGPPELGHPVRAIIDDYDNFSPPSLVCLVRIEAPDNKLGLTYLWQDLETERKLMNIHVRAWRYLKDEEEPLASDQPSSYSPGQIFSEG